MPVIVDGYNLLHAWQAVPDSPEGLGRSMLCRLLGDWSERIATPVTVVFDGATPPPELAAQLGDPRVCVIYSAPQIADAVINELVKQDSAPRRLEVVSSDRDIQQSARRRNAQVIESDPFARRVMRDLARERGPTGGDEPTAKKAGLTPEQDRGWLETFGIDPDAEEPFEHP